MNRGTGAEVGGLGGGPGGRGRGKRKGTGQGNLIINYNFVIRPHQSSIYYVLVINLTAAHVNFKLSFLWISRIYTMSIGYGNFVS